MICFRRFLSITKSKCSVGIVGVAVGLCTTSIAVYFSSLTFIIRRIDINSFINSFQSYP